MKFRSVNLHAFGKAGNSKHDFFAHVQQTPKNYPAQLRILADCATAVKIL
tara:strand:- start:274 stop:423 length:150 start_codon:yes stop_codon:yes gene_type:complete